MKNIKDDTLSFSVVIAEIQTFLEPVLDAIVNGDVVQQKCESNMNIWLNFNGCVGFDKNS